MEGHRVPTSQDKLFTVFSARKNGLTTWSQDRSLLESNADIPKRHDDCNRESES